MNAAEAQKFKPLPLRKAYDYAFKISEWIAPHCLQIEPVGAIRRHCSTCYEVELLTVPRISNGKHLLFHFLDEYVRNSKGKARWEHPSGALGLEGGEPPPEAFNARLFLPRCTLRIHCASAETWFLRLFETTGSTEHFLTMDHMIRSLDGHWRYARYIDISHSRIVPRSEGEIYELVKRSFISPKKRTD